MKNELAGLKGKSHVFYHNKTGAWPRLAEELIPCKVKDKQRRSEGMELLVKIPGCNMPPGASTHERVLL